jgi:hypothetical protein
LDRAAVGDETDQRSEPDAPRHAGQRGQRRPRVGGESWVVGCPLHRVGVPPSGPTRLSPLRLARELPRFYLAMYHIFRHAMASCVGGDIDPRIGHRAVGRCCSGRRGQRRATRATTAPEAGGVNGVVHHLLSARGCRPTAKSLEPRAR